MGWGVGIMQMEEALIPQEDGVKVTNHMASKFPNYFSFFISNHSWNIFYLWLNVCKFCLMIWSIVFVGAIISIKICVIELCSELYQKKNLVHVLDFNQGESKCAMNFEDAF